MRSSTNSSPRRGLSLIAIALVAVLALGASARSWTLAEDLAGQRRDPYGIDSAIRRFQPIAGKLPNGPVGYLTDVSVKTQAGEAAFMAAQYALAPAMLAIPTERVTPAWAVGNFSKPQDFDAVGRAAGYRMVGDYGNGVVLFQRSGR